MIRKSLFIVFWFLVLVVLLLFSLVFKDTDKAIVAQVEPMKKAISYHKAVRIEEIFVIPGQMVKPGDLLVRVERPDLVLDVEKKSNEIERLKIEESLAGSKFYNRQQLLNTELDAKLKRLEGEIDQLNMVISKNRQLAERFSGLMGHTDTIGESGKSYSEIELNLLNKEKEFTIQQYESEVSALKQIYEEELRSFEIAESQLEKELEVLLEEEKQLVKRAEITGTVGSISAQRGELLAPYSTILSIYESNPTVIKAIMNEGYKYDTEVGQSVIVESTNRRYRIEGKIIEIGARIIEYPNRLKSNQNIPMWGQELFIKIPEKNRFLNGERVFVTIK